MNRRPWRKAMLCERMDTALPCPAGLRPRAKHRFARLQQGIALRHPQRLCRIIQA